MEVHPFYQNIRQYTPHLMEPGRQAAVLLPFVVRDGDWQILLEVRANTLQHQPGEICLPGGMVEPGEVPMQAAVRETCEELLTKPELVSLWGAGDVLVTPAGQTLYSFLGQLKDYQGNFSKDEVHSVFTVPVRWLMEQQPLQHSSRVFTRPEGDFPYQLIPGGENYPWRYSHWPVYFYRYQGRIIWGITAKILYYTMQLVQKMGGLPPVPEQK